MSSEIKKRLLWVMLYKETKDAGLVCRKCGISRPNLRKWTRRFDQLGNEGLTNQSRRPLNIPKRIITEEMKQWIGQLRKENLGARRIQNELKWRYSCKLSLASIHKVLQSQEVMPFARRGAFENQRDIVVQYQEIGSNRYL